MDMTRKLLTGGALLLVGAALVFTAFAQNEEPPATTTQPETQAEVQSGQQNDSAQAEKPEITPFHEILAQKLGMDLETLQQAFEDAQAEFRAQLPERAQRNGERFEGQRGNGPPGDRHMGGRMGPHGRFHSGMNQGFIPPGMVKTTITHEFYHMGGPNQGFMQKNMAPGTQSRPGR